MTLITPWPVVVRERIVHAFKPGGSSLAEAPFRTLRRHGWASAGVRVSRRSGGGLAGQMTFFSSLNVVAARLARRGNPAGAERLARAAASLESGPEFALLRRLLSDLPDQEADQVVAGVLVEETPGPLAGALRSIAACTEEISADSLFLSSPAEVVFAGHIAEVNEGHVLLVQSSGPATMVPRWMAAAANRDQVGALLALVSDQLDGTSAVVEAVPAIEFEEARETGGFTPFGRGNSRAQTITEDDAQLLSGQPQPLRILVPVTIGE